MRQPLTPKELLQEVKDSIDNLEGFLEGIIKEGKIARIKPLSVELRKLLKPTGQGNAVLQRVEKTLGLKLEFPDRSRTLPSKTIKVSLNDYINRMIFSLGGRTVTRIELIKMVANQKGAHLDKRADVLHRQSQKIVLPLGNLARDRLFFEQNHMYLVSIAKTVIGVVKKQILDVLDDKF